MILVLATRNRGKVREIEKALGLPGVEFHSLADYPDLPEIEEDGATFSENARKKARFVCQVLGLPVLADDSGLVVDALNGAPGVFSARFAGPQATDKQNNEKLLALLQGLPEEKRTARFVCHLVYCDPQGRTLETQGVCEGRITQAPKGEQGFGYDPIFSLPEWGKTMAELPLERKNQISHRGQALKKMRTLLRDLLGS